ncbi:MAG: GNAT family N-acetyltransferase [Acidimicrobiia bacterium]|nr:GNAT family N-acetyltransferase [Acidimicrobiia bacterium]
MEHAVELDLADGTRLRIRPITPDDRDLIVEGMADLSDRSRFLRFHTLMRELSDAQLEYLTDLDYRDHFAWGAGILDGDDEIPVGISRYVRDADRPERAEAAVTVVDYMQGKGVGSLLLEALANSAIVNGIDVFTAYVLAENDDMLDLFAAMGASVTRFEHESLLEIPLPLPDITYRDSRLHAMFRRVTQQISGGDVGELDAE